jgi:hypothetical protein
MSGFQLADIRLFKYNIYVIFTDSGSFATLRFTTGNISRWVAFSKARRSFAALSRTNDSMFSWARSDYFGKHPFSFRSDPPTRWNYVAESNTIDTQFPPVETFRYPFQTHCVLRTIHWSAKQARKKIESKNAVQWTNYKRTENIFCK